MVVQDAPAAAPATEPAVRRVIFDDEVAPKQKGWLGRFRCLPKLRLRRRKKSMKSKPSAGATSGGGESDGGSSSEEDSYTPTIHAPWASSPVAGARGRSGTGGGRLRFWSGGSQLGGGEHDQYEVPPLLDEKQLQKVWSWLPTRDRIKNARIVYCTGRHGRSLATLYHKAEQVGRSAVERTGGHMGGLSRLPWGGVDAHTAI